MVFHKSLSDSKSPQVSRTLLSILADLSNIVVWMVSVLPLISNSSSLRTKIFEVIPSAPITPSCPQFCFFFSLASSLLSPFRFPMTITVTQNAPTVLIAIHNYMNAWPHRNYLNPSKTKECNFSEILFID